MKRSDDILENDKLIVGDYMATTSTTMVYIFAKTFTDLIDNDMQLII